MGKIIVLISTTPDGFADPQNVTIDPEFFEFTHSLMKVSDAVIFGRKTFEQFQDRWTDRLTDENTPLWMKDMAQSLNDIEKIVFSSTLTATHWSNSRIVPNFDIDLIKSFKNNGKGGLITFGSLTLIESLMEMNLVDEYYFNIQPVISGGSEARFFKDASLHNPLALKYVEAFPLKSGAIIIHYSRID